MTSPPSASPPLISVVIPCFNYAQYVAQAIESALAQSYPAKEVIVINDGSTDGSSRVIARYAEHVTVLDQTNQGHVASVNHAFAVTRGDIVLFLDADDFLAPEALETIAAAWYPSSVKVQYDLAIVDAMGQDIGRRFCNFLSDYDSERVCQDFRRTGTYRWPVTAGNAYSRWFLSLMFPLTVAQAPDGALNTVAPIYGDIVTVPRALASYRVHGGNLWSSNGRDSRRLPQRIRERQAEISLMRSYAQRVGVSVPPGNILDHELPFINYRLCAFKLGLDYDGKRCDSVIGLVQRGLETVYRDRLTVRQGLPHVLWLIALAVAPRAAVEPLIAVRASRGMLRARPWAILALMRQVFQA